LKGISGAQALRRPLAIVPTRVVIVTRSARLTS
jgi:hypothetical protein